MSYNWTCCLLYSTTISLRFSLDFSLDFLLDFSDSLSQKINNPNSVSDSQVRSGGVLFTGDILFIGGCGRFFEGNGEIMSQTLTTILSFPDQTYLYCGHEYTVNNLAFCLLVEPENEILKKKYHWAIERRRLYLPTIPSILSEEKEYNVFLRYSNQEIMMRVKREVTENENEISIRGTNNWTPIMTLEGLRRWRNREM